jgi:hypothetical protein
MKLNKMAENYEKTICQVIISLGKLEASLTFVVGLLFMTVFGFVGYDLGKVGGAILLGGCSFFMGAMAAKDLSNVISELLGTLKRLGLTSGVIMLAFVISRVFETLTFGLVLFIIISVYVLYFKVASNTD